MLVIHNISTFLYSFIHVYVLPKIEFKSIIALFGYIFFFTFIGKKIQCEISFSYKLKLVST